MSTETYRQCFLRKPSERGFVETTSYLPEKFAVEGRIVSLRDEDKTWTHDWKVVLVGCPTTSPPDWRQAIRAHRRQTGDSLPKTHSHKE